MKTKQKRLKQESPVLKSGITHWVCQETGEILEASEILKPVGRNGFMITYLTTIINLIDILGNKKMQVVKYLIANMDKSTNTIIITTKELAMKSKVSENTVIDTLKILDEAKITQRRTGAIMINPNLVHRGNQNKEKALITRFYDFGEANTKVLTEKQDIEYADNLKYAQA